MNNKAVSAVIGVILMVAIVVAISATTYVFISSLMNSYEPEEIETVRIEFNGTLYGFWLIEHDDWMIELGDENIIITSFRENYRSYMTGLIGQNITLLTDYDGSDYHYVGAYLTH